MNALCSLCATHFVLANCSLRLSTPAQAHCRLSPADFVLRNPMGGDSSSQPGIVLANCLSHNFPRLRVLDVSGISWTKAAPADVPEALVIAPVKGVDPDLAQCASALLHQDYPDYRVVFVAERDDDPACEVVTRAIADGPAGRGRLLLAGEAPRDQGQKLHNQRPRYHQ